MRKEKSFRLTYQKTSMQESRVDVQLTYWGFLGGLYKRTQGDKEVLWRVSGTTRVSCDYAMNEHFGIRVDKTKVDTWLVPINQILAVSFWRADSA